MASTPYASDIPGYDYGSDRVARSPVSLDELDVLRQTVGFTEDDRRYLAMAGEVLADQAEDMVDAWRAKIASQEHLARWFAPPGGQPDERYKAAVKPRFVRWVNDLCTRPFERDWLDYQEEIGLRHTPAKKNRADHAAAQPLVPLRYLLAFTAVVVTTAREFLGRNGHSAQDVDRMLTAWTKAVLLSVTLWSRPYAKDELW